MKTRNPVARALRSPSRRMQVIRDKREDLRKKAEKRDDQEGEGDQQ